MAIASNNHDTLSRESRNFLDRSHRHFIDGDWATGGGEIAVIDPSSTQQVSAIAAGASEQVDQAVKAAHTAFNNPSWRSLPPLERERLMLNLASLMEQNIGFLSELETVDNGMPKWFAEINVGGAAGVLRYMAGWASKICGDTVDLKMPFPSQFFGYTNREPVGVIGAIVPWNVPLMMALWKVAPALAAGCTVVLKPSENSSLTALVLADLAQKAGFPPGVINVVTGYGSEAGEALVAHPLVSKISFTGSTTTGKHINRLATETLKKVTLELGGKSPTLVLNDADPERAISGASDAIFTNAGQVCVAGSRLYVQRELYEQVVDGIVAHADAIRVGAGLNPDSQMGPLINAAQRQTVEDYIQGAVDRGGERLTHRDLRSEEGYYVAPTVIAGLPQDDPLVKEEVFGPVLTVAPFDDIEEAIALANDSCYGLAAGIFSQDVSRIHQIIPRLKTGKVSVNHGGFPYPALPEGGTKQSGFGRDLGREAIEGYLDTKSVSLRVD